MAGVRAALWSLVKPCITGSLIGVTVADRYLFLSSVQGSSMLPTFEADTSNPKPPPPPPPDGMGFLSCNSFLTPPPGELALVERLFLHRYHFSRGDVVVFRSPTDHRTRVVKRVIGLPGDWIQVTEAAEIRQIPEGHCWVEGDNGAVSWDSRGYGPVPLGLMQGRVTHVVWPPHRIGRVDRKAPEGRVMPR